MKALAALLPIVLAALLFDLFYLGTGDLPKEALAGPLSGLGLWGLSLYFFRKGASSWNARLIQLAVLFYVAEHASRSPAKFLLGGFALLSLVVWPLSLPRAVSKRLYLGAWLVGLAALLLAFYRPDFVHLLVAVPFLIWLLRDTLAQLRGRYPWLPALWLNLPLLLLIAGVALRILETAAART